MFKLVLFLVAITLAATSPAFAGSGNGNGRNATVTSSHPLTNSGGANQTQTAARKAGGGSKASGKEFLRYKFDTVFTTGVSR